MTVYVSIPTYNTRPHLLQRAITSLLNQSATDIRVVVIFDGEPVLAGMPEDKRLVSLALASNMGRYFCDSVVHHALEGEKEAFWKPHDADDWSEPDAIEMLVDAALDGAALSSFCEHYSESDVRRVDPTLVERPGKNTVGRTLSAAVANAGFENVYSGVRHLAGLLGFSSLARIQRRRFPPSASWAAGIYTIERVQRAGGVQPGIRVGYDSLFLDLMAQTGKVGILNRVTYHYDRTRRDTLTTSRSTGYLSKERSRSKIQRMQIAEMVAAGRSAVSAVRSQVDEKTQELVQQHGNILKNKL